MSATLTSTSRDAAPRRSGTTNLFVALIPWLLFTFAARHESLRLAAILALVSGVAVAAPGLRAGRPKLLELAAVATFAAFTVVAFTAGPDTAHWISLYARAMAAGVLALIAGLSALTVPFTEQYARESVPERFWGSRQFRAANRRLSLMWAGIFAAMVPFHVLAGAIDTNRGNLLLNWLVPIALVIYGVKRSQAEADDAPAAPAA